MMGFVHRLQARSAPPGFGPQGLLRFTPSLVTWVGLGLSLWWFSGGPVLAAMLGVVCDVLDGWLARRLQAESEVGSLLDWTVDVVVAALTLQRLHLLPALLLVLPAQVVLRRHTIQVSGRAGLVALALLLGRLGRV